jgi:MFS family permease
MNEKDPSRPIQVGTAQQGVAQAQASAKQVAYWSVVLPAVLILLLSTGTRQSMGLFISPINTETGLGIVALSFAVAVGQFVWGAVQPIAGAIADRYGPGRVIAVGGVLLFLGTALTPLMNTQFGLVMTLGILSAAGAGAGSFAILLGSVAQRLDPAKRSFASGLINAGGSLGQFVFAPIAQYLIALTNWKMAMTVLAVAGLISIPLAWPLRRRAAPSVANAPGGASATSAAAPAEISMREQLRIAFKDRSYLLLHAGFFTCGFHIAFLVTHLPQEIQLCGLPANVSAWSLAIIGLANIVGSLAAGALGSRYRMKYLLFYMYAARAVMILVYLFSPKTELTFYIFAAALGLTWLATVPPTAGLVAKLFGLRYLATLFGLTLLSHQTGGFLGAYLGGVSMAQTGNYQWMWYADIMLAVFAALVHLPIREARLKPAVA